MKHSRSHNAALLDEIADLQKVCRYALYVVPQLKAETCPEKERVSLIGKLIEVLGEDDVSRAFYESTVEGKMKASPVAQTLKDLLAVIHRDGGHHTAKVGVEQSIKDAMQKIHDMRQELAVTEGNTPHRFEADPDAPEYCRCGYYRDARFHNPGIRYEDPKPAEKNTEKPGNKLETQKEESD